MYGLDVPYQPPDRIQALIEQANRSAVLPGSIIYMLPGSGKTTSTQTFARVDPNLKIADVDFGHYRRRVTGRHRNEVDRITQESLYEPFFLEELLPKLWSGYVCYTNEPALAPFISRRDSPFVVRQYFILPKNMNRVANAFANRETGGGVHMPRQDVLDLIDLYFNHGDEILSQWEEAARLSNSLVIKARLPDNAVQATRSLIDQVQSHVMG